ncbi:MAG: hypothetical protein M0C28_24360 [Candidatus Moduliflexus flocculans]|nr:hypothetical protein [Candidatus Moduliflexus flocculans]
MRTSTTAPPQSRWSPATSAAPTPWLPDRAAPATPATTGKYGYYAATRLALRPRWSTRPVQPLRRLPPGLLDHRQQADPQLRPARRRASTSRHDHRRPARVQGRQAGPVRLRPTSWPRAWASSTTCSATPA